MVVHARLDREEAVLLYRQMVNEGFDNVRIDEEHEGEGAYGSDCEEMQGPHQPQPEAGMRRSGKPPPGRIEG